MATKGELYDLIFDDVRAALDEPDHSLRMTAIRDAGDAAFALAYEDAGGDPDRYDLALAEFSPTLTSAATHTFPDGSPEQIERIAMMLATAASNAAVVAAAPAGQELRWVTMLDDRVRDIHRPLHGEVRAAGTPFIVDGTPLMYPGQPVGPPEVWINCRCTLHAALTAAADDDALVARTYSAEQRRKMASRGTAMPDGSFPIADVEDLRNAIQAIGRAKDPEKAKRHIRKRARALGATNLLPDSWTASGEVVGDADSLSAAHGRPSPPGTHDAPGWITNPRETQRLRTYWTKGEGALKIRWGQGGDFDRCRKQLRKYIPDPEFLAGTCANLHYVALGFWPGQPPHGRRKKARVGAADDTVMIDESEEFAAVTQAFIAAAQLDEELPPIEWFEAPPLTAATPVTISDDDEFIAHLATWDTCHVGISGGCTTPPRSTHGYAYFRTGEMLTAGGPVPVGQITMDTGHAGTDLGPSDTVRHYDDTGTVVADVAAGEDDHGIWVHGMLRPGITPEQRRALRAGSLSGDWRRIGGNLELVAALVVNVPGFPIPRPELAASAGIATALVAAAPVVIDPNAIDPERIALAVVARLEERDRHSANAARVAALRAAINTERVGELVAAVNGAS